MKINVLYIYIIKIRDKHLFETISLFIYGRKDDCELFHLIYSISIKCL